MKKLLFIPIQLLILPLWLVATQAQTTYGPTHPISMVAGYFSDHSASTVVTAGGSVTMTGSSTYEHGNLSLQNSGTWSSAASLDLFNAAGAVTISGTTAPGFFNLQFTNGGTVSITNSQGINVGGQLTFGTSGIISTVIANTSTGSVHFADNAVYTGGNTDLQHVNGYVTKAGNDAFVFPIGSATDLRTLAISAPATATNISAAWFLGNPGTVQDPSDASTHSTTSLAAGLAAVSQAGFWDYILVSGNDDGITVTVSIPSMITFATAGNLRLVGWNGTQWINLSGSTGANGNTENSTLSGTIPVGVPITALAMGSTATPLPVHYTYFDATAKGCNAELEWNAETDADFKYFSIERSEDGNVFAEAGTVTSEIGADKYAYTDNAPGEGTIYYRIKDVETDGSGYYTAVKQVVIRCGGDGRIKMYPTPTKGTLHVELPKSYEQATIYVTGMNGQKINTTEQREGLNRIVQLGELAAGQYLLTVENNGKIETFNIIYQR